MGSIWRFATFLVAFCALGSFYSMGLGQTPLQPAPATPVPAEKPSADTLFTGLIEARLKQIDQMTGLDEATRRYLQDAYKDAQKSLAEAKNWTEEAAKYKQKTDSAPKLIEQTKAELAALPAQPALPIAKDITLAELEQTLTARETELTQLRADLEKTEKAPKQRATERAAISARSASLRDQLTQVNTEIQSSVTPDSNAPVALAQQTRLRAKAHALQQELMALDRKIEAYAATADLLPLQSDLAARKVALAEQELKTLQEIANYRRQQDADQQAQAAKLDAAQAHPAVKQLADQNASYADERKTVARQITEITAELSQANEQLAKVKQQSSRAREKFKAVGLTNAIGMLLRKQREDLPNLGALRPKTKTWQQAMSDTQLRLLQLGDRRKELQDMEAAVGQALRDLKPASGAGNSLVVEHLVREALQTQKEYLDTLIAAHNSYYDKLGDLDVAQHQLIGETEQCSQFIDEHVLWIASDPVIEIDDLRHASDALWWLVGLPACAEIGRALAHDAFENPTLPLLAALVFVALFTSRRQMRAKIRDIGELATRAYCYRFMPTASVLAMTVLLAALWPSVLLYLGWRLSSPLDASELCKSVGAGLIVAARVYFALELIRQICQHGGLAEKHFEWSASIVKTLRQNAVWLRLPLLPATFVATAMDVQNYDPWDAALGRVAFVTALALCTVLLQRILRPNGGVFQQVLDAHRGSWLDRLRFVWYPMGVLAPPTLAVMSIIGYYYTAQQLAGRLAFTTYLLLGFVLLRAVLLRWILVSRRKLAIAHLRQRHAPPAETVASEELAVSAQSGTPVPERDLATIDTQTRRLIEYSVALAGLLAVWMVWVDVMPALGFLTRVDLWQTTVPVNVSEVAGDGTTTILRSGDRTVSITLADLLLALLTVGMTVMAVKNIPGLMEMAVLQHLPVDAGARYAVATVSRYLITIVGLVSACGMIGLGWSKVQWLVAGVSVGLGFGMQEIFANFVSGLIILFERPVRVGDVITINNTTGKVSRVRMRATTILDGDRRELIVPNKEFITGQVLNWTLSDQVNRVVINVGVAYGSDTTKASELLLRVANDHPTVLQDPAPRVTLESFGASSLDFVLRCYLPNLENRLTVIHELHLAIDKAFREAGIDIAFPQHDVHVRTIELAPGILESVLGGSKPAPSSPRKDTKDRRAA